VKSVSRLAVLATALVLSAALAQATPIVFSSELSDMDQPDLGVFDATLDYSFDSTTNILTIEVFNQTVAPNAYTLSEFYFNVSDDVTGMSLLSAPGFAAAGLQRNQKAGPFGTFDYLFDFSTNSGGKGSKKPGGGANAGLAANSSVILAFRVSGHDLDSSDFFFGYSEGGGKDKGDALAAAKFTQGPGDDSVYAISLDNMYDVVPEPSSMLLMGMGIAGFLARRKTKRS
jgi:hypothetical protein